MNKLSLVSSLAILLSMCFANAHDGRKKFNIDEAIRSADLIFLGTVIDVNYATSKGDARLETLPHTFVTYQIQRLLKGNPKQAQDKITLRFMGGRGEEADFLHPANYPLFDLKDTDVIFVKGNTVKACPLVECATTRMRALGDLIFNERSQQVVMTRKEETAFGKFEPREEVLTHQVSQTTIKAVVSKEESEGPPEAELPIGKQFDVGTFVSYVDAKVKKMYSPEVMDRWPIIPTANIQTPFTVKPLANSRPKMRPNIPFRPPQAPTAADLDEEKKYLENKQNPVIKQ